MSRLRALVVALLASTTLASAAPPARADEGLTLAGTATAVGMRFTYTVPSFLVAEDLMDGGGPVASARLDSTGVSAAFASLPYPGELGVAGPALIGTVLNRPVPFSYPFYTNADYPSRPKDELADPSGVYRLRSNADAGKASGVAAFASPDGAPLVGGSASSAEGVRGDDGSVTMTAESVNTLLSFGNGMLRIAYVRSVSQTVLGAGETSPATTTKLVIEGARVGDQSVTIGPDGVHPASGGTVPVPMGEGTKSLNEALKAAGISVRTVSTDSGEVLEVASTHPLPFNGSPKGTAVWRFGGAHTAITVS
jgi:hypothetical protein